MKKQSVFVVIMLIALFGIGFLSAQNQGSLTAVYEQVFKKGDADQLSKHMNSTIELKTPKKEGSFSKKQTTLILENFFSDNPVSSFKIKRNGKFPDSSQFFLCEMKTNKNKTFRVYFVCKETSGKWLIHILKFENN